MCPCVDNCTWRTRTWDGGIEVSQICLQICHKTRGFVWDLDLLFGDQCLARRVCCARQLLIIDSVSRCHPNERHLCKVDEGFDARWRAWILMRHGHKQRWYEWERIHSVLKGKKPCSWDDLLSSSLVLASPQKTVQPWHVCLWKLCQRSITFLVVLSWSPLKISKDS